MTNITRYEPMNELFPFEPFRGLEEMMRTWPRLGVERPALPDFRMDLYEDGNAYYLTAELPGMKKEDIAITVDGNLVTIAAEMKEEKEQKGQNALYTERRYGRQARSFTVRHEVDEARAEAAYKEGVLQLTLPKKAGTSVRQVEVH